MNIAHIEVSGVIAAVKDLKQIPAGLIGGTVTFDFKDDQWKHLTKTVCFVGAVAKDVVGVASAVTIPCEVLAKPGRRIAVGVYGTDAEGKVAVPTLWAELGFTQFSADPSGDTSTDPSLPVWAQLQEEAAEALAIAKGRAKGYVFDTVEDLDTWLTDEAHTLELAVGDNFYIRALDVPDYWWDGAQKQPLETQKVEISGYVKDTDYATVDKGGVVKVNPSLYGVGIGGAGTLVISAADNAQINGKTNKMRPIVPANLDYAVKKGLADSKEEWTEEEKAAARNLVGAVGTTEYAELGGSYGLVKLDKQPGYTGITINPNGSIALESADNWAISQKANYRSPITPSVLDYAVKVGMTTNTIPLTDEEKQKALEWLGVNDIIAGLTARIEALENA